MCCVKCIPQFVSVLEVEACMQSMIAINWPLLILTDSPGFPRKLTIAGMAKMCGNEAKVANKRFNGNWGNLYTRDLPHSNIFLLSEYIFSISR